MNWGGGTHTIEAEVVLHMATLEWEVLHKEILAAVDGEVVNVVAVAAEPPAVAVLAQKLSYWQALHLHEVEEFHLLRQQHSDIRS